MIDVFVCVCVMCDVCMCVEQVKEKFCLERNEEEAVQYFQGLIDESVKAVFAVVVEQFHKLAQVKFITHCLTFYFLTHCLFLSPPPSFSTGESETKAQHIFYVYMCMYVCVAITINCQQFLIWCGHRNIICIQDYFRFSLSFNPCSLLFAPLIDYCLQILYTTNFLIENVFIYIYLYT